MSSLSSKDRVSLCIFTYADGRRCRLPENQEALPARVPHRRLLRMGLRTSATTTPKKNPAPPPPINSPKT
jgi:hypothetical protein